MAGRSLLFVPLALVCSCSAAAPTTNLGTSPSALTGTLEPAAAGDCSTTYVNCVRVGGTTCRDDLHVCIAPATTPGPGTKIEPCLAALEVCAASSSTALETCVSDTVTCVGP